MRTPGRCARGEQLRSCVPHGYWQSTTFVTGLLLSGIAALFVLDGQINRETFRAYVDQVLMLELNPMTSSYGQVGQPQEAGSTSRHRSGGQAAILPPALQA